MYWQGQYMGNNPYQQIVPQQMMQQPIQQGQAIQQNGQSQQPIQNGGYFVVPSEDDVQKYPVAPGNFITFKINGKPIIIEKSMGYSQFDDPKYKRYKMVEEDMPVADKADLPEYALKSDMDDLTGSIERMNDGMESCEDDIKAIRKDISSLQNQIKEIRRTTSKKKEADDD